MDYILYSLRYMKEGGWSDSVCFFMADPEFIVLEAGWRASDCNASLAFWLGAEAGE